MASPDYGIGLCRTRSDSKEMLAPEAPRRSSLFERLTLTSGAEERPDCAAESTLAPTKSTHLSETLGDRR
jgi:hypothetical protein